MAAISAVLGGVLMLTACGGGDEGGAKGGGDTAKSQSDVDAAAAKDAAKVKITIAPKDGATNVGLDTTAVSVADGTLTAVELKTSEGATRGGAGDGAGAPGGAAPPRPAWRRAWGPPLPTCPPR
ncbi:hypothetical protein ACFVGY_36280, partial [Streptomyces sp. NPDC127106]